MKRIFIIVVLILLTLLFLLASLLFFSPKTREVLNKETQTFIEPLQIIVGIKPNLKPQKFLGLQAKGDESFAKWDDENRQKWPWLDKLPLHTQEYYVYFNIKDSKLVIFSYKTKEDASNLVKQLTAELTNLGIPVSIITEAQFIQK